MAICDDRRGATSRWLWALALGVNLAALPGCGAFRAMGRGVAGSASAVAACCHRVTPEEKRELADAKTQISKLLGDFEAAVGADEYEKVVGLLSPMLDQGVSQEIEGEIKDALRTWTYSDYKLYYPDAVEGLKWRHVAKGRTVLKLKFRTSDGKTLRDRFVLRRFKGKWHLGDVRMHLPEAGDFLDLPAPMRDDIMSRVEICVNALRAGDDGFGAFITAVEERQRHAVRGEQFEKNHRNWIANVECLFRSSIKDIKFSRERTPIIYSDRACVLVAVPLSYKFPPNGDRPYENVALTFVFVEQREGWELVDVQLPKPPGFFRRLFGG